MSRSSRSTTDWPATATSSGPSGVSIPATVGVRAARAGRRPPRRRGPGPTATLPGVAAVVAVDLRGGGGPGASAADCGRTTLLHREAEVLADLERGVVHALEVAEHRRAVVPGRPRPSGSRRCRPRCRHRDAVAVADAEAAGQQREVGGDLVKTSSEKSTRSILFTTRTTCGTRSSAATARCRRVCSSTPLRASTSSTMTWAVEEPVTVLRVYCTCPGQSARMNLRAGRREVAVGDVDRDALLALGAQAVGEQRQVGVVEALAPADLLDRVEGVGQHRVRVEQQPADQGRLAVVHGAGRGEPEQRPAVPASRWHGERTVARSAVVVVVIRSSLLACGLPWRPR